ncbi:hypothetical protein EZV73_06130 [Acidaminobacter sp. JC074]|uniref:hypothetical protein n=1 Tax=Acidaminobacter sp. JC074 TaxID=2530199 RepID=UPI001F10BA4F|nr:hypothetical protein [Acidaminobacter sp. JC074]MCH4887138.1 hypothetical protein [Acidaminobacter sp. JC074]
MLAVHWVFGIHNLIITYLTVSILKQLFYIKVEQKMVMAYVLWMQLVFVFNDFVIQVHLPLEYKYPFLFLGFLVGFLIFLKLPLTSSVLIIIVNMAINSLATNVNIFTLLIHQFKSYGLALENDFYQYTTLVMVMMMIYIVLRTFDVRILDISRYN